MLKKWRKNEYDDVLWSVCLLGMVGWLLDWAFWTITTVPLLLLTTTMIPNTKNFIQPPMHLNPSYKHSHSLSLATRPQQTRDEGFLGGVLALGYKNRKGDKGLSAKVWQVYTEALDSLWRCAGVGNTVSSFIITQSPNITERIYSGVSSWGLNYVWNEVSIVYAKMLLLLQILVDIIMQFI